MFNFLNKEEEKQKSMRRIQSILEADVKRAKKKEIMVGIDPETLLGCEIFKQSREIIKLRNEIHELKKMTTELISRLDDKSDFIG